jgi:chemotaxis protein CheY-P-specific phosphatase CheC
MDFSGDIQGRSHIIITKKNALQIICNLFHISNETPGFDNFMTNAMVEIGNIVIHSIVGSFCKILHSNVEFSIPDYFEGTGEILSHWNEHSSQFTPIKVLTHFLLESVKVSGFIFLFMELKRFDDLIEKLEYLGNTSIAL